MFNALCHHFVSKKLFLSAFNDKKVVILVKKDTKMTQQIYNVIFKSEDKTAFFYAQTIALHLHR
jgi:hypothetical protein